MSSGRHLHHSEFYALLDMLANRLGGTRHLSTCTGRDIWPSHGVYFFFEPGELRIDGKPRVVRVGTHGLRSTSRTTLWKRLAKLAAHASAGGTIAGQSSVGTSGAL